MVKTHGVGLAIFIYFFTNLENFPKVLYLCALATHHLYSKCQM